MSSRNKAPPTATKKLQIQLGIVKRMQKEVASYEKEVTVNEAKVQKMREDGKDSYDIKKFEEVLQESYMMIPDSKNRLDKATEELSLTIDEVEGDADLDPKVLEEARSILALASGVAASSASSAADGSAATA